MNSKWSYLSYPVNADAPAYGGQAVFFDEADKQVEEGDSCNTRLWRLSNHFGTHIDFPRHFDPEGRTMDEYPVDFFIFNQIGVADLGAVPEGQIIGWDDLKRADLPVGMDLLLVKTGFCHKRHLPLYWQQNPGFDPRLADALRQSFPNIRVLGFDSISLSSFAHREMGRKAHTCFLDHDRPILPLEDMDLANLDPSLDLVQVIVAPFRVSKADGVPCTVIGEWKGR